MVDVVTALDGERIGRYLSAGATTLGAFTGADGRALYSALSALFREKLCVPASLELHTVKV